MSQDKVITRDQLLNSDGVMMGAFQVDPPEVLLAPFFDALDGHVKDYRIVGRLPKNQTVVRDNDLATGAASVRTTYERILIEAILDDEYQLDSKTQVTDTYRTTIGLVYATDTAKPVAKVYLGQERDACLNLMVSHRADVIEELFTSPSFRTLFTQPTKFLELAQDRRDRITKIHENLTRETLGGMTLEREVGRLTDLTIGANMSSSLIAMTTLRQSNKDYRGIRNIYFNAAGEYTRWDLLQMLIAEPARTTAPMRPNQLLQTLQFFN